MATTKVRKIGNSLGVLLPVASIDQLSLKEGDTVSLTVVDGAISMRPLSLKTERLLSRSVEVMRSHRDALKGLGHE